MRRYSELNSAPTPPRAEWSQKSVLMSVQRAYTSLKNPKNHYERNEVQLKSWSDQLVLIIKQEKDELEIMGNFMVW